MQSPLSYRKGSTSKQYTPHTFTSGSVASRYTVSDVLGEGTYGKVMKATDTVTGKTVAIKTYTKGTPDYNEIDILFRFQHPNLLHGLDIAEDNGQLMIVLPYGHSLDKYLKEKHPKGLSIGKCKSILFQLASAVHFLHSTSKYFHCDIKPQNIILVDGEVKLADFGLSYPYPQPQPHLVSCGTPKYTSIQTSRGYLQADWDPLDKEPLEPKNKAVLEIEEVKQALAEERDLVLADIHSLGVTLYVCMTGEGMVGHPRNFSKVREIIQELRDRNKDNVEWQQLCDLVQSMTTLKQSDRMQSLKEVLNSPLFAGEVLVTGDVATVDVAGMKLEGSINERHQKVIWDVILHDIANKNHENDALQILCLTRDLWVRTCSLVSLSNLKSDLAAHGIACYYIACKVMYSYGCTELSFLLRLLHGLPCSENDIIQWTLKITAKCNGQLRSHLLTDVTDDAYCIGWYLLSPFSYTVLPKSTLIQKYNESDVRKDVTKSWRDVVRVQGDLDKNYLHFKKYGEAYHTISFSEKPAEQTTAPSYYYYF